MRHYLRLLLAAAVLGLAFSAPLQAQPIPGTPKLGVLRGTDFYSSVIGPVLGGTIDASVSGATQFASSDFDSKNYGDDYFNYGWLAYVISATNISAGSWFDITDFVSATGTFTTTSAGADWALGDKVFIIFGNLAKLLESSGYQTGLVTSVVNSTTASTQLTIPEWTGINPYYFQPIGVAPAVSNWAIYIEAIIGGALSADTIYIGQWRFVSSIAAGGVFTVTPGFTNSAGTDTIPPSNSTELAAGMMCIVSLRNFNDINPVPELVFRGQGITSGTPAATTITFAELVNRPYMIHADALAYCLDDASGATNDGQVRTVTAFDPVTGVITVSPGFSAAPAVEDLFEIHYTGLNTIILGAEGFPTGPTATKLATGVNIGEGLMYVNNSADTAKVAAQYVRSHIDDLESDADTCEVAIQSIRGWVDTEITTIDAVADTASAAATYIRSHIDDLESDADTSEAAIQYVRSHIDDLESDADTTELAAQFVRGFIEDLESDADTTESRVQAMHTILNAATVMLDTLDAVTEYTRSHIDDLESDADTTEAAAQYIRSHIDDLESDADSSETAIQYVRSHIDDLESDADTTELRVQAIHTLTDALRDSLEDANDDLQALLGIRAGHVGENLWKTDTLAVDFSVAGWNTAAAHGLWTVTGAVEFEISAYCSTNVATTSSDSLWLFQGESGATGYRIVSYLGEDLDAGENLFPQVVTVGMIPPAAAVAVNSGGIWKGTIFMGKDIKYQLDDHAFASGVLVFVCRWRPITTGSTIAKGTGA